MKETPSSESDSLDKFQLSEGDLVHSTEMSPRGTSGGQEEVWSGAEALSPGTHVGRYRIVKTLGRGGFGVVYLANDTSLGRDVALKMSRVPETDSSKKKIDLLNEARAAASLDHANIIRIFDIDRWQERTYIVMELVHGNSIADEISQRQLFSMPRILSVAAQVAAALEHIHAKGIIHRDMKPANVLLAPGDIAKVTDLGLALSDDSPLWFKRHVAGTRLYMSPEQILGEVHRIDGRTDIWGFGMLLYEMLTLRSPFRDDPSDIFRRILKDEIPSPRQRRPDMPHSLELLCLKCLSKPMSSRFQSSKELREAIEVVQSDYDVRDGMRDIVHLDSPTVKSNPSKIIHSSVREDSSTVTQRGGSTNSHHDSDLVGVTPRGLRPFDASDSAYYYRLMPGPYDLEGKPAILSFWKRWIEETTGNTQPVGVIYGPSGCGKSSFVQAALIPCLKPSIKPLYFNFTVRDPVRALIKKLHEEFEFTREFSDLPHVLYAIRESQAPFKLLLVLDQFEQYLVDSQIDLSHTMVQALRQCDGARLQAIILVRDEFWSEISLFMQLMETMLSDGDNAVSLPLMGTHHAQRVLESFGRAYESLPSYDQELTPSQNQFIELAIDSLAEDNLVLSVRVAMFADLMRKYPWDRQTLMGFGGADGAIARYLRDSFDSHTATMSRRSVAASCAEILRELLPVDDREIKAAAKPVSELALVAHESSHSLQFQQAIQCLENDLHLITRLSPKGDVEALYSLAHDYLVRPIQAWLQDRDSNTWQGRARHRLTQASLRLQRDPATKNLLGIHDWIAASLAVPKRARSRQQQKVLSASRKSVVNRMGIAFLGLLGVTLLSWSWMSEAQRSRAMRHAKISSEIESFLTAKPESLDRVWRLLSQEKELAATQVNSMADSADNAVQLRRLLLMALLGQPLSVDELVQALRQSDDRELRMWQWALRNSLMRDSLVRELSPKSSNAEGPRSIPEIHWMFLSNLDHRLLRLLENSPDPMAELYKVLAVADGESDPEYQRVSKDLFELFIAQKQRMFVATLAIHVLGLADEPARLSWKELESFLQDNLSAPDRSVALASQRLLSNIRDRRATAEPSLSPSDWRVDKPIATFPLVMVRLPQGEMPYQYFDRSQDDRIQKASARIVVKEDLWMSRDELSEELFMEFKRDLDPSISSQGLELGRSKPVYRIEAMEAFRFCNWLSELAGLESAYAIDEGDDSAAGDWTTLSNESRVRWNRNANGYRFPSHAEFQYASVCGDCDGYWKNMEFRSLFNRRLSRIFKEEIAVPSWQNFANAWGLTAMTGSLGEVIIDDDGSIATVPIAIQNKSEWRSSIPYSFTDNYFYGFRLVCGRLATTRESDAE